MRYMGSKGRHAKSIVPFLMEGHNQDALYVEPFCGGGNILSHVPATRKWANDTAVYAVALLESLSKGWLPPNEISNEEYRAVRAAPDDYPPEYVGFVSYCCSYAGKFWGGYARGKDARGNPRNYAAEQVRYLKNQAIGLQGCRFTTIDYLTMDIPSDSTVYLDPPYSNTTSYVGQVFDSDEFWQFCENLAKRCRVFVSEYSAPRAWEAVWIKSTTSSLTRNTGIKRASEMLFCFVS